MRDSSDTIVTTIVLLIKVDISWLDHGDQIGELEPEASIYLYTVWFIRRLACLTARRSITGKRAALDSLPHSPLVS